ncbi:MAG: DNA repair protein RecN [Acidobacteriota bacterium]|jgi:DNA repair protein RecN (Recombination protein N)|nr:DNA repair protein RecN [Acidobacteriota bacterium]
MLRLLRIRNLALIRELEIEFGRELNILTGETGSGKSIVVDALGLVLGARASQELIRADCDSAVVEGLFEIGGCLPAAALLKDAGFETEDGALLVRREIAASGRGRIFINDNLSSQSFLKSLGEKLADIHGQQDQQALLDLPAHLRRLDEFGGNGALCADARARFRALRETARLLDEIENTEQERLRRIDMLRFQIDEIEKVKPLPGEKEDLEKERDVLSNRERIVGLTTEAYELLYESEAAVLGSLTHLGKICRELCRFDPDWNERLDVIEDCRCRLEDVAFAARDYADGDFSAERLEAVHERLDALGKLIRKYGTSCEEVVNYGRKCAEDLDALLETSDSAERLTERFENELKSYEESALRLSEKRREDALRFERAIRDEFGALAMERMEMRVKFHTTDAGQGNGNAKGRVPANYGPTGMDKAEFLIAPNKGEDMRPLAKIASGGELSRLMLSIKSLCGRESEDEDRTLVFDEVDSGVGGRVAETVGRRLKAIAANSQVLCVTHLAQVAVFGERHFNVSKDAVGERTETTVRRLEGTERTEEIARMLGGETITPAIRRAAEEMLEQAREKTPRGRES